MLEDLDSVNWGNLTHAYGSAADVPDLLRALDSASSLDEFKKIYSDFWNVINHQGTVYEATSHATRFIIQMLAKTTDPLRKIYHLTMLAEFLRVTQYYPYSNYDDIRLPLPISRLRHELELYDVISEGIEHYLELLSDDNIDVRTASTYVLSFLVDHCERILPTFIGSIEQTQDPWLQACAVWSYATIISCNIGLKTELYTKQLLEWTKSGLTLHMRYASALGHLKLSSAPPASMSEGKHTTPDSIIEVVAQGLMANMWEATSDNDNQDPIGYVRHEATPFDNAMAIISRHCLASFRPHTWIAIVQRMQLSPTQAHLYFREIFDIAFLRVNMYHHYNRWHNLDYLNVTKQYESFTYIHEKQPKHYQQGKALMEGQQLALDAVTKCDSFWEIPTNLFSFFYGLPNDRGELRKLISASS